MPGRFLSLTRSSQGRVGMMPRLSRSIAALLFCCLGVATAQTLRADKSAYRFGEEVRVTFTDVPLDHLVGGPRSIVIARQGAPDDSDAGVATRYLMSDPSGVVTFQGLPAGVYEARLFYLGARGQVQARTLLTVSAPATTTPAPGVPVSPGRPTPAPAPVKPAPPKPAVLGANPPMGEYAVYQWNGSGGFAYQYRFTLVDGKRYRVRDAEWGAYTYNTATKALTFSSGPLRGFGGLYYTQGRNADGPTIALNPTGTVVKLDERANGAYQFAFFRPGGVR